MLLRSPLRYPGSKRKLVNYLERVLTHNNLLPQIFIEPFVGGGNVFINFLKNHQNSVAIIADKDELVYSFWKTLFIEPSYLINFVKRVNITVKNFDRYRFIAANPTRFDRRELARACLFLNRTSFSGILNNSAGPIGGREQSSVYKIDCRFGRKNIIKKIKEVSAFKNRVTILHRDWQKTLKYTERYDYKKVGLFFYFDPPFFKKADQLYRHYFNEEDHKNLRAGLLKLKAPWILSYDKVKEIQDLYANFMSINVSMPYSINSPAKRLEKELIITPLKLPRIKSSNR